MPELVKYERDLHIKFSFPAIGVCGYNLLKMYNSGNLDALWPILRAHSVVIMTGPGGSTVMTPEEVESKDMAQTMKIPLGRIPVS